MALTWTSELRQMEAIASLVIFSGTSPLTSEQSFSWSLKSFPASQACTTVMRLVVNVPVLSLQMFVAPPMASHALSLLTRLLSLYIFCIEYAKLRVTASGSPSGTATTTMVTAIEMSCTRSSLSLLPCP